MDALIDWLIDKNRSGYQMVNSVDRLQEMKAFMRMSSGLDLRKTGWHGDGANGNGQTELLASMPGILQDATGELRFVEWGCRAGQNNVIIRTDGTVAPCFPMYSSSFDWGNIDEPKFDQKQLTEMKKTCQRHCFSTLNHNLAYCYNDARVIKWLWCQAVKNKFQGGARRFDDRDRSNGGKEAILKRPARKESITHVSFQCNNGTHSGGSNSFGNHGSRSSGG